MENRNLASHAAKILGVSLLLFTSTTYAVNVKTCLAWLSDKKAQISIWNADLMAQKLDLQYQVEVAKKDRDIVAKALKTPPGRAMTEQDLKVLLEKIGENTKLKSFSDQGYQWRDEHMTIPGVGRLRPQEAQEHFQRSLEPALAKTVVSIIRTLNTPWVVNSWFEGIKIETLKEMWADGIQIEDYKSGAIREYYTDKVLARHAAKNGLAIKENGLPFDLHNLRSEEFYRNLSLGRLFIEWSQAGKIYTLPGMHPMVPNFYQHYGRGLMLQIVFLSEHVENFSQFLRDQGKIEDSNKLLYLLFTNYNNQDTPYSKNWWVFNIGIPFLHIRY